MFHSNNTVNKQYLLAKPLPELYCNCTVKGFTVQSSILRDCCLKLSAQRKKIIIQNTKYTKYELKVSERLKYCTFNKITLNTMSPDLLSLSRTDSE